MKFILKYICFIVCFSVPPTHNLGTIDPFNIQSLKTPNVLIHINDVSISRSSKEKKTKREKTGENSSC